MQLRKSNRRMVNSKHGRGCAVFQQRVKFQCEVLVEVFICDELLVVKVARI